MIRPPWAVTSALKAAIDDSAIMAYVVGDRSELKPGANIAINGAVKKPDRTLEANRVNVGRGDVVPN